MPVSILDLSSNAIVNCRDPTDAKVLRDLWGQKPVVILFLRRLGCMLCRNYAKEMDKVRPLIETKGGQVVALSFEAFGEGSDSDRTFEKFGFWTGPIYKIDQSVYEKLFGSKKMLDNLFGLLDMKKEAVDKAKADKTPGNYSGNGFILGGQFVVNTDGKVILDHRQKVFGDDATFEALYDAVCSCLPPNPS